MMTLTMLRKSTLALHLACEAHPRHKGVVPCRPATFDIEDIQTTLEGTPGAPTHCGMRYARPTTKPATPPNRSDARGSLSLGPQSTRRTKAPVAPAVIRPT